MTPSSRARTNGAQGVPGCTVAAAFQEFIEFLQSRMLGTPPTPRLHVVFLPWICCPGKCASEAKRAMTTGRKMPVRRSLAACQ